MAVSFKVPSSPRKDVFQIENFMGVDFTNTGSSIDEVRSPNAENMVRYVPGKVRKRTGYKTQVEFSSGTDVNRAKNSWNSWKEIEVTATEFGDADTICEFYDTFPSGTQFYIGFEAEAVGSYRISQKPSTYGWNIVGTEEEPYSRFLYQFSTTPNANVNGLYVYRTAEAGANDYLRIRNIKVFWKTSATSWEELRDIEWKAAPEDKNCSWIKTESDEPINGVYKITTGDFDGDRIADVNRVKNAYIDTWTSNGEASSMVFAFQEAIPGTQKINLRFEYQNATPISGETIAVNIGDASYPITDTAGIFESEIIIPSSNYDVSQFEIRKISTMQVRNIVATYSQSGTEPIIAPSPESLGKIGIDIKDLYDISDTNYSATQSGILNDETTTDQWKGFLDIGQNELDAGLYFLSIDASTTAIEQPHLGKITGNEVISYYIGLRNNNHQHVMNVSFSDSGEILKNHDEKHFEKCIYVPQGYYFDYILVDLYYWGETVEFNIHSEIKNIKIRKATIKESYEIVSNHRLYHVGDALYLNAGASKEFKKLPIVMNNVRSVGWQFGNDLYLVDGKKYRKYNSQTLQMENLEDVAYIPTVTDAKEHDGGGVSKEPFNMLQPAFIEMFYGSDDYSSYQLSVNNLDGVPPKVWVMDSQGIFQEKTFGTDYDFTASSGVITFTTAPGESPLTGEPNIKIQAYKTINDYADRINKCSIGTLFGVNGASDRLFLSGNPDHKNWDFFSEQYDPTYFPDTGYSQLGLETSAIVGYSKVNNYLATHKDEMETEQNVLVREGDLIKREVEYGGAKFEYSDPAFKLINTIQGAGAYGKHTFKTLSTEPIFLTKSGLYAITPQDLTGEKYGQNRSFFLNGKLLKEENLGNACATVYNEMYILAVNNKLYILDGLQPIQTDRSMPYATRQYVGFYCTNVPANVIYTQDDALWIGTNDGRVCRFDTDIEDLNSYNDDGEPIYCCWETPDLDGKLFYKNKTFRYFAIRMMKALRTSVECYYNRNGNWSSEPFKIDASSGIVFDFNNIDFSAFSFSTNNSEKVVHSKVKVKKVDKAKFKIENKEKNEPLGLLNLALEYVESGNYKG